MCSVTLGGCNVSQDYHFGPNLNISMMYKRIPTDFCTQPWLLDDTFLMPPKCWFTCLGRIPLTKVITGLGLSTITVSQCWMDLTSTH